MKLTVPKNATKREREFIESLQQGLSYAKGKKSKGVIVEKHPKRAVKK